MANNGHDFSSFVCYYDRVKRRHGIESYSFDITGANHKESERNDQLLEAYSNTGTDFEEFSDGEELSDSDSSQYSQTFYNEITDAKLEFSESIEILETLSDEESVSKYSGSMELISGSTASSAGATWTHHSPVNDGEAVCPEIPEPSADSDAEPTKWSLPVVIVREPSPKRKKSAELEWSRWKCALFDEPIRKRPQRRQSTLEKRINERIDASHSNLDIVTTDVNLRTISLPNIALEDSYDKQKSSTWGNLSTKFMSSINMLGSFLSLEESGSEHEEQVPTRRRYESETIREAASEETSSAVPQPYYRRRVESAPSNQLSRFAYARFSSNSWYDMLQDES